MAVLMITILDNTKAIAGCTYSADLSAAFKDLEGPRKWRRRGGFRFEPSAHNVAIVARATGLEIMDLREDDPTDVSAPRPAYKEKTKSFPHQIEGREAMRGHPRYALFCEQGTGKSKMGVDACGRWYAGGLIDAVLVVAPKGVDRQWVESQFADHYGGEWHGSFWTGRNKLENDLAHGCLNVFAIGYDALKTPRGRAHVDKWITRAGRFCLILDESHYVKNAKSKRWEAVARARAHTQCKATLLCTGTPIAKNLIDEWAQLKLLDEDIVGIKYVTMFKREFCIMGGFEMREVIGPRNLDRYKARTAPYVFRARKDDLDIPPKMYSEFNFNMTPRQAELYKEMANRLIAEIDEGVYVTAANAAVAINALQQISCGFTYTSDKNGGRVHSLFDDPMDNPRVAALVDLLDARELEEKTIIWCRYLHDIATLTRVERFKDASVLSSQVSALARAGAIEQWLDPDGPHYLIGTPGTGGTGLNLQGQCRTVIYFSNSENSVQRWQSEDRVHRIGTTEKVIYVDLVARGSRDRAILRNLKAKRSLSDLRLDDIRDDLVSTIEF